MGNITKLIKVSQLASVDNNKNISSSEVLNDKMNIGEEGKAKGASSRGSNVLHVGTSWRWCVIIIRCGSKHSQQILSMDSGRFFDI